MLTLYSTEHCHLCEQATVMLDALAVPYKAIEIIDDDRLLKRYGALIPVLSNEMNEELQWPFNEDDIQQLLKPG